jgi:hypothetical protein
MSPLPLTPLHPQRPKSNDHERPAGKKHMSSTTTVAEFAAELNKSPATLIEQLTSAGVAKAQASDPLSEADKQKLLGYLRPAMAPSRPSAKKSRW